MIKVIDALVLTLFLIDSLQAFLQYLSGSILPVLLHKKQAIPCPYTGSVLKPFSHCLIQLLSKLTIKVYNCYTLQCALVCMSRTSYFSEFW